MAQKFYGYSTKDAFIIPKQASLRDRINGVIRMGGRDFESLYYRLDQLAADHSRLHIAVGIETSAQVLSRLAAESPVARLRVSRANQFAPEGDSVTVHHLYFSSGQVQESIYRL